MFINKPNGRAAAGIPLVAWAFGWLVLSTLVGCSSEKPPTAAKPVAAPAAVAAPQRELGKTQPEANAAVARSRQPMDLSHLPPDAEVVLLVRAAEIQNAPLIKSRPGIEMWQQVWQQQGFAGGLSLSDFDSGTIGVSGISERLAAQEPGGLVAMGLLELASLYDGLEWVAAIRTTRPIEAAALTGPDDEEQRHQEQRYVLRSARLGSDRKADWLISPTLFMNGPEEAVKRAIERRDMPTDRTDLAFVDAAPQVVLVVRPRDREAWLKQIPFDPETADQLSHGRLLALVWKHLAALSLGIRVDEGMGLELALDCGDSTAGGEIRRELDSIVAEAQSAFSQVKPQIPPELGEVADLFLSSVKLVEEGGVVRLTGAIPPMPYEKLKAAEMQLFGAVMQHALPVEPDEPPE
ncbi:MAG: hypothetical protein EXS05_07675 [Planctomycetaceae bacterium]|nr:hypothetical protein [Planctomycetaceae bacterium]